MPNPWDIRAEPGEKSQAGQILKHLEKGNKLTPLDGLKLFGSFKLSSRCGELRECGYNIKSEWITVPSGKRVKRYFIRG